MGSSWGRGQGWGPGRGSITWGGVKVVVNVRVMIGCQKVRGQGQWSRSG